MRGGAYHRIPVQTPDGGIFMTTPSGHLGNSRQEVIGTTVKNTAGQKIGQVEDLVLDKTSNNIIFAVVGFGGFPA